MSSKMDLLQFVLLVQSCFILTINAKCKRNSRIKDDLSDVISDIPKQILQITYEDGVVVEPGVQLTQREVVNAPRTVTWKADPDQYYSLVAVDADIPAPGEFLHWLFENIRGNDLQSGDLVSDYFSPMPADSTHRYIFIVCEQQDWKDSSTVELPIPFKAKIYLRNNNCEPVAINYFKTGNDLTQVDAVLNKDI